MLKELFNILIILKQSIRPIFTHSIFLFFRIVLVYLTRLNWDQTLESVCVCVVGFVGCWVVVCGGGGGGGVDSNIPRQQPL